MIADAVSAPAGWQPWRQPKQQADPLWPHVFMALFGAGWAYSFDFGVRFYAAELVALAGLVLTPWTRTLAAYPMLRRLIAVYALWVGAICLADLYNHTAWLDWVRNCGTPILGGISLAVVTAALARNPWALLSALLGMAVAKALLGDAAYGDAFSDQALSLAAVQADSNILKVKVEPVLTPLILLAACFLGRVHPSRAAMLFAAASVGYLLFDARSAGILFLFATFLLIRAQYGRLLGKGQVFAILLACGVAGYGAYAGYTAYTLAYNPYGHHGKQLRTLENPYNPFEMLSTGRSEWLVLPAAIAERPVFGWGSWAQDEGLRFSAMRAERAGLDAATLYGAEAGKNYIPGHSLIGTSWLWSGILGLATAIWLLVIALRLIGRSLAVRSIFLPAVSYFGVAIVWHVLFSPSMAARIVFPLALASLVVFTHGLGRREDDGDAAPDAASITARPQRR